MRRTFSRAAVALFIFSFAYPLLAPINVRAASTTQQGDEFLGNIQIKVLILHGNSNHTSQNRTKQMSYSFEG
jgi:hypothetical protein